MTLIWTNCLKSSLGKTLSTAAWYMYGAFLSERSKHLSKKTPQVWPIRFSEHVIFSKVLLEKCNVDEMLENGHLHIIIQLQLCTFWLISFSDFWILFPTITIFDLSQKRLIETGRNILKIVVRKVGVRKFIDTSSRLTMQKWFTF